MDGKELVKALISRKFAIAFFGILFLYLYARLQPGQAAQPEGIEQEILAAAAELDPNSPAIKANVAAWLIPTYMFLIVIWTVGNQCVLDYFKQRDADAIELHRDPSDDPAEPESEVSNAGL